LPKNEDGEFELILGNRQLLSVFFIVVILLGVFFTMGYIVGRNSPLVVADINAAPKTESAPAVAETSPKAPEPPASRLPPTETAPQQPISTSPQTAPEPAKPVPEKPAPARPEPARLAASNRPVTGQTYLQLAATTQHEADIMVDVLRKKSFRAIAAEIDEKPGTFRVLVGPITDTSANRMRADLQGAGFPGNAAIRRTF
jgi:SPOR domain